MVKIRRNCRLIDGVLLLDKPTGMTSNRAVQIVKRLFRANKAGHTGALDPLATGLLPICLGEATKFSQWLLDADKTYEATAMFGVRTDTSDADGQVVEERDCDLLKADIEQALVGFRGDLQQVPSMFSALKYQGKPLYEYARAGIDVPREARPITVYDNQLLSFDGKQHADFQVSCSKGTYIRTLIDDLGQALGCGAHVQRLRRTTIGHFKQEQMITLDALEALCKQGSQDELLLPIDSLTAGFPSVTLTVEQCTAFRQGQSLILTELPSAVALRVYDEQGVFWGLIEQRDEGTYWPKRVVNHYLETTI